jgi:hypothetical protein
MTDLPSSDEPYIALPSDIGAEEFATVLSLFSKIQTSRARVLYHKKFPVANFDGAGSGGGLIEFADWVVNFRPLLFRDLALWTLATYTAKEFVKGFAAEAGKAFWNGVKALGEMAFHKVSNDSRKADIDRSIICTAKGTANDSTPTGFFSVEIAMRVQCFERQFIEVQRYFLPLAGCLMLRRAGGTLDYSPRAKATR